MTGTCAGCKFARPLEIYLHKIEEQKPMPTLLKDKFNWARKLKECFADDKERLDKIWHNRLEQVRFENLILCRRFPNSETKPKIHWCGEYKPGLKT